MIRVVTKKSFTENTSRLFFFHTAEQIRFDYKQTTHVYELQIQCPTRKKCQSTFIDPEGHCLNDNCIDTQRREPYIV